MRKTVDLDIVGSTRFGRYNKISIENTYNMIISDNALVPYSGYEKVFDFRPTGFGREIFRSIPYQHLICVIEDGVYAVSTTLGSIQIGILNSSTGPVYITENGIDQIAMVDGTSNVYVFNHVTNNFSVVSVPFVPNYITFQDGYFIVSDENSNQWRLSDLNDATSWPSNPENIGILETKGDRPKSVIAFRRQLFVIGQTVSEIWHDVGNTLFPYQRDNSLAINYGILSADTLAAEFNLLVWLGQNRNSGPTLLVSTGGEPRPLANDGIEFLLDQLQNPQDSSGFLFQENGHIFYQITFFSDNISLTYDFNTNLFFTLTDQNLDAHIAKRSAFFNNENYFVSNKDSGLYKFGSNFTTYDGSPIPRIRITKPFRTPDSERFIVNNISLTMEQGVSYEVQKVLFSVSKDGGASFGNIVSKELNNFGRRRNKMRFWNIGAANDITFKFQFWSGNPFPPPPPIQPVIDPTSRFVVIGGTFEVFK
ncbi:hypothetical protein [Flavobacterium sp.]|uniref:hypothetical protein n=1 Tax=Flavobacterium sp. TaxID=239 RepID=UPI003F6A307C